MEFKVLGKRVLIAKPETPESPVLLTDDVKAQMEREMIAKWSKLPVAAVGEECNSVKAGDQVYVGRALEHAEVILIEEQTYFMINEAQVSIVW
jgi:co-chaperonin GroES (HSP10)